ncbi:hypothetical protein QR680_006131 [Steinernema hermaphroditum]|uniref:Uncharacterized protein n=1 Tax=Steinernema hermaphroditum TaxID=289476 RepID=A0AA39LW14_9BILA|nr:hypothetical protein QR680_006131 [Steinernema hermaphroditum]
METRVWLLLAGALLFYETSAQTIEINTMDYDHKLNKKISVTERFDRCPQYNFRNNFYHALTCAGFVRAHMDDLERKRTKKRLDWNADIDEKLAENADKPCFDNAQFKVFYYDEKRLIFLRFGEHGSHVSYWITENLQDETVFVQFPHPLSDKWKFIAYANLGHSPLSNHVCDPELAVYYPATKQFQFSDQGSYFDLETKRHTLVHLCTPPIPYFSIRQVDPMMSNPRSVLLIGANLYPYRHMQYYNQIYDQHSIVSFNYPLPGYVKSKYYAVVVFKNDEKERKLFEQKLAERFNMLEPCYIRVIRPDLHESHEMLMTPYSVSHKLSHDDDNHDDDDNNNDDAHYYIHDDDYNHVDAYNHDDDYNHDDAYNHDDDYNHDDAYNHDDDYNHDDAYNHDAANYTSTQD